MTSHLTPQDPSAAGDRPELSGEQETMIFRAAGLRVAAAVENTAGPSIDAILGEVADTILFGAFVSLKHAGQLRSCIGSLGEDVRLADALDRAAIGAALHDRRFPPVQPRELDGLDMEVWLLWAPKPIPAQGEDRIDAVEIGRHGLQIECGKHRGLLLPGVPVEHDWDPRQFMEHVCLKAGLPADAWTREDAVVMTFEGYAIRGPLIEAITAEDETTTGETEMTPTDKPTEQTDHHPQASTTLPETAASASGTRQLSNSQVSRLAEETVGPTVMQLASLGDLCRSNLLTTLAGGTPVYFAPRMFDGEVLGAAIYIEFGVAQRRRRLEIHEMADRSPLPLQNTLLRLVQRAARSLREYRLTPSEAKTLRVGLAVMNGLQAHGMADKADFERFDPRWRAMMVMGPSGRAFVFDPKKSADELLGEAITLAEPGPPGSTSVLSLAIVSTERRLSGARRAEPTAAANASANERPRTVRSPAVAGAFYPGSKAEIDEMLDEMLDDTADVEKGPWSAVLAPHAGWIYSGSLAARTLARVQIPPTVIILAPRHRQTGELWAVAPETAFAFPGGQLEVDTELAERIVRSIHGMAMSATAHRQEHAIEVMLPILHRLAPDTKIVPITIGGGGLDELTRLGEQLAEVIENLSPRPLILVSTDMNHFADEETTRKVDAHAIEAIESLDPTQVYDRVIGEGISMCGVLPTVIAMSALSRLEQLNRCEVVGYTTSAEVSEDRQRVVGYAGILLG